MNLIVVGKAKWKIKKVRSTMGLFCSQRIELGVMTAVVEYFQRGDSP